MSPRKRGPGRPKLGALARSKNISVMLTPLEMARIAEAALIAGKPLSVWLRDLACAAATSEGK